MLLLHRPLIDLGHLDLQPPGIDFHDPGKLADAENPSHGQVPNADSAHEWHQVVLTQRKHFDVFDHNHLIVVLIKDGTLNSLLNGVLITLIKKSIILQPLFTKTDGQTNRQTCRQTLVKNIMALAALVGVSCNP